MEPITEGKRVLSDIEQSIQNALALFNTKNLGASINDLYVIDDPIVSLHDPQNQEFNQAQSMTTDNFYEGKKSVSPKKYNEKSNTKPLENDFPFKDIKMSQETIVLPFLDNPVKSTIDEMKKVLDARGEVPFPNNQPSPEEILNIYSQNLGISLSNNSSPRGINYPKNSEFKQQKQNETDKTNFKKTKQQKLKLNQDKKIDIKKRKTSKLEAFDSQENKLKELMNIYGCRDKMKKPHSDSTLGSKSELSRKASTKKLKQMSDSTRASSTTTSKKGKRKKQKNQNVYDINLCEGDLVALDKSSRISGKRKSKQKNNIKLLKKPNLKRKIGTNSSNDNVELKLSKSHQTHQRDHYYNTSKLNNTNHSTKDINQTKQKQLKQKSNSYIQKESIFHRGKESNDAEEEILMKSSNKTILNAVSYTKQQYGMKYNPKSNYLDSIPNQKTTMFVNKPPLALENEKVTNSLNKKISGEAKLNKQAVQTEINNCNTNLAESQGVYSTHMSCDGTSKDFIEQSQLHYTLPTQSSRSKEVERFLSEHYQHLPFVIGQSTNKSHNLWVNIQEALSLIKQKVPQTVEVVSVDGAGAETERPLSVVSKFTTKSVKKPHQCPALTDGLYDIPEANAEVEDLGYKSWEDHPDCFQANLDPTNVRPRCVCMPKSPMSCRKVLSQVLGDKSENVMGMNGGREDFGQDHGDSYTTELRKALVSFTQEFEDMNNKYEEMLSDPNASKDELERLETLLENKEEEIKEIIARFNEVKEYTDKARLEGARSRAFLYNAEPYKSTTSIQLAQTLRRVQQFKESLKSRPSVSYLSRNCHSKYILK